MDIIFLGLLIALSFLATLDPDCCYWGDDGENQPEEKEKEEEMKEEEQKTPRKGASD